MPMVMYFNSLFKIIMHFKTNIAFLNIVNDRQ